MLMDISDDVIHEETLYPHLLCLSTPVHLDRESYDSRKSLTLATMHISYLAGYLHLRSGIITQQSLHFVGLVSCDGYLVRQRDDRLSWFSSTTIQT
jgi:hypothetical protein